MLAEKNIKELILLGKYTENGGSLTVIAGEDCSIKNPLESLFNNIISYSYSKYEFVLNYDDCITLNIEKILTKTELNKLKNRLSNL